MHRDRAYLFDILEAAKRILQYTEKKSEDQFISDIQCQDAVIRRFEIIGEAARRISDEMKNEYPEIPWFEMVGMRNIMIHEYDDIDMTILWDTIQKDLPPLISLLEKMI